jgi:hypothetical protein
VLCRTALTHNTKVPTGDHMNSGDKIIPITRGRRKPDSQAFAVIVGRTRVTGTVGTTGGRSEPAALIGFTGPNGTTVSLAGATRDEHQPEGEKKAMSRIYRIEEDNRVRTIDTASESAGESAEGAFQSASQLAELVADWPLRRLAEVWNKLPGVRPLTRFENRGIAVQRIWRSLNPSQPPVRTTRSAAGRRPKPRSKTQTVLALLRRPEGATLRALMQVTRWQAHTVRGFLSRKVVKSLGLPLQSMKRDGERVYALPAAPPPIG